MLRCAGVFVLIAQPLNSHLADNWQAYATQPYFDANGGFICFMWSTPLIIMEFAILVCCAFPPATIAVSYPVIVAGFPASTIHLPSTVLQSPMAASLQRLSASFQKESIR